RAEGMTVGRMPLFSVSILVTASLLLIAVPVFVAGLVLLWLDQHFGGQLFAQSSLATDRLWQHFLYLSGWPLLLLMAVPAFGAMTDAVAGHARRQLLGHSIAGGLLTALALLSVLTWAAGRNRLYAISAPITTIPLALVLVPIALLVLLWVATVRFGSARFHPSLLAAPLMLVLVGAGIAGFVAALAIDVEADDAAAFARGNLTLLALGVPAVALVGAVLYWAPKVSGRAPSSGAGGAASLLVFLGVLVAAVPGWIVGFDASDETWGIAIAGGALLALGFVATAAALKAGPAATDDPYGATTLEWATTSPPPPHNFDRLPEIRSAAPLADVRPGDDV
ncbi:MAG: cbb3-type cytochrome c oxidase subunit I, partial [Acidimicrobiia bacterium]